MKKIKYIVRDLDILSDNTNELEERLQEYGNHGFKIIISERYVIYDSNNQPKTYFRCILSKEYTKNLDKDEDGYEELFEIDNI